MSAKRPSGLPRHLAASAIGYLFGTVPSSDLVTRCVGLRVDLRSEGTGNPGAANAAAVLGKKIGFAVMLADIAKGVVAGRVGRRVAGPVGVHVASTAAVVGHCLPVWNRFRGGKGVATSVGQVLVGFPAYFPIDAAVGVATVALPWWKQRTYAATSVASVVWVVSAFVWWRRRLPNLWGPEPSAALPISALVSSAVIHWRFLEANRRSEIEQEHDSTSAG